MALSLHLPGGTGVNHEKNSIILVSVPLEIRAVDVPNTTTYKNKIYVQLNCGQNMLNCATPSYIDVDFCIIIIKFLYYISNRMETKNRHNGSLVESTAFFSLKVA